MCGLCGGALSGAPLVGGTGSVPRVPGACIIPQGLRPVNLCLPSAVTTWAFRSRNHARGPDCCGVQRHVLLFFSSNRRLNLRKSSKRGLPGRCSGHRRVLHASRCALRTPQNLADPGVLASNISVSGLLSISPHKLPGGLLTDSGCASPVMDCLGVFRFSLCETKAEPGCATSSFNFWPFCLRWCCALP